MAHLTPRSVAALAASLLAVFLLGCAQMSPRSADAGGPGSVLQRIQDRGALVVGMAGDMPPLNYRSRDGEMMGLEVDLARGFARRMNVDLAIDQIPFAQLLPALQDGRVDMVISGMTITPTRNRQVAFTRPYLESGKALLTKRETLASAESADAVDSPALTVVALQGSTSAAFVEAAMPKATLVTTAGYDQAVQMVLDDKADVMVADYPITVISVFRHPNRGLVSVRQPLTYEPLGIALPAADPLLLNWVENTLGLLEGGGQMEALQTRWLEDTGWVSTLPGRR